MALEAELQTSVLISAESPPGQHKIHLDDSTQNILSDMAFLDLLSLALWDEQLTID